MQTFVEESGKHFALHAVVCVFFLLIDSTMLSFCSWTLMCVAKNRTTKDQLVIT